MREYNYLDDMFKEKVQNYSLEVPNHIWSNIEQKRTWKYKLTNYVKQRKWMALIVLLFLASGAGIAGMVWTKQLPTTTINNPINSLASTQVKTQHIATVNKDIVAPITKQEQLNTETDIINKQAATNNTARATSIIATSKNNNHIEAAKNKQVASTNNKLLQTLTAGSNKQLMSINQEHKINTVKGIIPTNQQTITKRFTTKEAKNNLSINNTLTKPFINQKEVVAQRGLYEAYIPSSSLTLSENRPSQAMLSTTLLPSIATKEIHNPLSLLANKPKDGCYRFPRLRQSDFLVDVIFAPQYVQQQFINGHQELNNYVEQRKKTEQFELAFTTGLRLGYQLKNGFVPKVGLFYSQINETFEYEDDEERRTTVFTQVDTIIDAQGNVNIIFDTLDVIQEGIRYIKTYNKHRMINVPLLLGYQIDFSRWALEINAGGILNLWAYQRGKILSPNDMKPMDVRENDVFKQRYNWNWYASIGWYYKWKPMVDIIVEPSIQYTSKPITKEAYAIQQKNHTIGLQTGVRFRF